MRDHVRILGILHIVFGALGVVGALIVLAIFGGIAGFVGASADTADADRATGMAIMGGIGVVVFVIILVISAPSLIAGFGLLKYKAWARILTIVLSALDLLHVPLGTALGVYGLWVLLNQQTEALFRAAPPGEPGRITG